MKFGLNLMGQKAFQLGRRKVLNPLDGEEEDRNVEKEVQRQQQHKSAHVQELQQKAIEEDQNVFDYDAVYDDLKKQELIRKQLRDPVSKDGQKKARYMEDLINASKKRKLMLEKQKEKRIQMERELEEEMFGDKEEFVTEAYKQRKEELKRMEEEERKREEKELDPNRERDVAGFYRGLLHQVEKSSGPLILGDQNMSLVSLDEEVLPRGLNVSVSNLNDNEEVVDKRELLKGGLNVSAKATQKKQADEKRREQEQRRQQVLDYEKRRMLQMQRERNKLNLEQQKVKVQQEKLAEKRKEREEVVKQLTSSTSNISDAKARYLARKVAQSSQT
jgi:hypothetical protein